MIKFIRAATLIAGAIVASQSALAQFTANDLYMGFQNQAGAGSADYIINLGSASSIINNGSVFNLSTYFSLGAFDSAGLSGTNSGAGIMGGVVGGSNGNSPSDIYVTQLRSGGVGIASMPGSSAPNGLTRSQDNEAYASMAQITSSGVGMGVLDTSLSWQNDIEPTYTPSSLYGTIEVNPDSLISQSSVLYEDLWGTSNSSGLGGAQPFVYEGYFTLDLTGSSPDLTFTPAPEPSSIVISGAGGILLLLLRNRLWRRKA